MKNELLDVLMRRDNMTKADAIELIKDMRSRIFEGEDPEEVLYDIGLEPDYVFDLI